MRSTRMGIEQEIMNGRQTRLVLLVACLAVAAAGCAPQRYPRAGSQSYPSPAAVANADGSYDIYFGPKAPKGKEANWIQTLPGKGWFTILRLYSPLQAYFDKSWRIGEIELVK